MGMINKSSIVQFYKDFQYRLRIRGRRRWSNTDLQTKLSQSKPVNSLVLNDCKLFWENVLGLSSEKVNYKWFDVYNSIEEDKSKLKYYVPDDFWYAYIDSFYTDINKAEVLDDKNFYDLYFHDVRRPRTIVRKIQGNYLDSDYNLISKDTVFELCEKEKELIIKPAVNSWGGAGIKFWKNVDSKESLYADLKGDNIVVQEIVKQHDVMAHLHEGSLNTIRIMVMIHEGEVIPLSTVVRMGVNNAKVDNASSGGIVCGVNKDGRLKDCAYNTKAICFDKHPQGAIFQEHVIPNFDKCIELAKNLAPRFAYLSRLQSWDIAIDHDGQPTLIEANLTFGQIDFQQMCNGPIFGNKTEEILRYVVEHNKFLK